MYNLFHGEIYNNEAVYSVLRNYFPDYNYKGVFFDIGAFEPIRISNSYHFERNGWECYCFEANTQGIPLLKEHRKNVFNYAISNEDKNEVTFNIVLTSGWTAGFSALIINEEYKKIFNFNKANPKITEIKVPQKTLNTIIETEIQNLTKIDIISLDIEGGELNCLYGLDLKKYNPSVLVVENVTNDIDIQNYLKTFGYKLDKKIHYNEFYVSKDYDELRNNNFINIIL
jgi:FkbM family methyltransferase